MTYNIFSTIFCFDFHPSIAILQQFSASLFPSSHFHSIFPPYLSSSIFLTSRCLTYFLRLLQCSSPLYSEDTHIDTQRFSITPCLDPPTGSAVPGKRDSTGGLSGLLYRLNTGESHSNKSGQWGELCLNPPGSLLVFLMAAANAAALRWADLEQITKCFNIRQTFLHLFTLQQCVSEDHFQHLTHTTS